MIDKIKMAIMDNIGKVVVVTYNGSRNKVENYKGIIKEVYNSFFIIKLDNGLNKSFLYADLLTGIIDIKY